MLVDKFGLLIGAAVEFNNASNNNFHGRLMCRLFSQIIVWSKQCQEL